MKKINFITILLIGVVFLLSGCSLKSIDEKLGEGMEKIKQEDFSDLEDAKLEIKETNKDKVGDKININDLTSEQKELINKWLEDNGFNRYGDPLDTMYTGGTPLFNEITGASIDRFQYILDNHPDILKNL